MKLLSHVRLFATSWTVAYQAPLSMEFSRQEYWSGLPVPSPQNIPNPGIKPRSSTLQADSLPSEPPGKPMCIHESQSEVTQSCPTLCDLMDCSLPGSSVHGIFQARILEWVAISPSRRSPPRDWTQISCIVGRHFTVWDTREVPEQVKLSLLNSPQSRNWPLMCKNGGDVLFC